MSEQANDNMREEVRSSLDYIKTGGLGEMVGIADEAMRAGFKRVTICPEDIIALSILAQQALDAMEDKP